MKARILSNNLHGGNYTTEFLEKYKYKEINNQHVIDWNLTEVLPGDNLHEPFWNGLEWIESATAEEISQTQLDELIENEKQAYIKRAQDGQEAYATISAEFRLAKLSGTITEEAHAFIEKLLIPVRNEVLAGQWMSALKELELIGSEAIGQQLYDRLHLQISNYINENYN